jgi:acetate---CoA ligase (ADP-forming)
MNIKAPFPGICDLDRALRPSSVAILGASNDPLRISGRTLHYMRAAGYKGEYFPINSRRETVQGIKAYATLADVPVVPDVAIIALPAESVEVAVEQCVAKGVGSAVIYAAGFAEKGAAGEVSQNSIFAKARAGNLRLFGPNCIGILNSHIGFVGSFSTVFGEGLPKPSPLAVVAQSGAYAGHLLHLLRAREMGVGYWISTGNEADIEIGEVIEWLAVQDDVSVIMAYLEGARNGPALARALRVAHDRRKAVICMKVGHSAVGTEAAKSHTASLAGSDAVYNALFEQYGAHRASTTEEHVDIAYAALNGVYPAGNKLGIITVSGGFGIQLCDAAEKFGLDVAPLSASTRSKLEELNPIGTASNPCDTTAAFLNDMSLITGTLSAMNECGEYDSIIGSLTFLPASSTFGEKMREAIVAGAPRPLSRPIALCMAAKQTIMNAYSDAGFLVYEDSERAVAAIAALQRIQSGFDRDIVVPAVDETLVRAIDKRPLSEVSAQTILSSAGVPFLPSRLVKSRDAAIAAFKEFNCPVALKIVSPDIQHKTEIGGVMLDVVGALAVSNGFDELYKRTANLRPSAKIEGVLLTPMAPEGIETILGVNRDPIFGPIVMFGLGGVTAELFHDVAFQVAPFDREAAYRMIRKIRGFPLLAGYRGQAGGDIEALVDLLVNLSAFAAANSNQIEAIDLNPVLVRPIGGGVIALDAVLIPRQA